MIPARRLVALGALLCVIAAALALPALYVPGLALVALLAVASGWVALGARTVAVDRVAAHSSVEEGTPVHVTVTVRRTWFPLPGRELRVHEGEPPVALGRGPVARVELSLSLPRRGRHPLSPAYLVVRDPFGLCRRTLEAPLTEVLVLPRVEEVGVTAAGGVPALGRRFGRINADAAELEVDALRPHHPGAPASRIHWPTVARTGTLLERGIAGDSDRRPLVIVDPRRPADEDALDQAMRAAASLCVHLATRGGCLVALPGVRRPQVIEPDLLAWPGVHARLAVLQARDGAPPVSGDRHSGTVLWVTASAQPPATLVRGGGRDRYLVSPRPLAGRPIAFTVAGCSAQRVGSGARRAA